MNNAIALAVGDTYELVSLYGVTAHPAQAPYPRKQADFVAPIKKGGAIEKIYSVQHIIECLPQDVISYASILNDDEFKRLAAYVENRYKTFHFNKKDTPYRFYVMNEYAVLNLPYYKKYIQVSTNIPINELLSVASRD